MVCPYYSVGCSIIVSTTSYGKVINTEGDTDSPINAGTLCSKGSFLYQLSAANPNRLRMPLYQHTVSEARKGLDKYFMFYNAERIHENEV